MKDNCKECAKASPYNYKTLREVQKPLLPAPKGVKKGGLLEFLCNFVNRKNIRKQTHVI